MDAPALRGGASADQIGAQVFNLPPCQCQGKAVASALVMLAFGLAIFTGAFLLFLVQPLIARFILPWFGGGPAVWTTCMLFFQTLLLGGYAYAHLSIRQLAPRRQVLVHLALLAAALFLLPVAPGDEWKPPDGQSPTLRILILLTACLGLPYLVLSATGPLMQAWFSEVHPGVPPYRLYALSNVGSLLALVGYPFFVEPNFSRRVQADGWSMGLGVFALLATWCGVIVWRRAGAAASSMRAESSADTAPELAQANQSANPSANAPWLWFALPACGSVLLLAVTNKICQDIAVVPFLWVLPLSLYLLSFIVSFDSPRWYHRRFWLPWLVLALATSLCLVLGDSVTVPDHPWLRPIAWLLNEADDASMFEIIAVHLVTLFVCCMVCHGEVYRLRPAPDRLTGYFLTISAGGAFGGLFVAVLAPILFKGYFELHAGLGSVGLLVAAVLFVDERSPLYGGRRAWAWAIIILAGSAFGFGLIHGAVESVRGSVEVSRSFYGVLKVNEDSAESPEWHEFKLVHGGTTHGLQMQTPDKRRLPSTYYTGTSGVGRMMKHFPRRNNRRIGLVGLGTGTLAAWGRDGDYFRIYEIDDSVQRLARRRFSYLNDSAAQIEVVLGDARLSMEREPDQRLDFLVLDAFSSDAIPVHLLTREAFEIYGRHLQPDGVIAVHISNVYLDLEPIVLQLAEHFGYRFAIIRDSGNSNEGEPENGTRAYGSDWILLSNNAEFLELPEIANASGRPRKPTWNVAMWTDEMSDLFRILMVDEFGWLHWLRQRVLQ